MKDESVDRTPPNAWGCLQSVTCGVVMITVIAICAYGFLRVMGIEVP